MSDESRDVKTAENVFSEVFKEEKDKELKKECTRNFLDLFLDRYKLAKKDLNKKESGDNDIFREAVKELLLEAEYSGSQAVKDDMEWETGRLGEAYNLGESLGYFLGAVEFGIAKQHFSGFDPKYSEEVLAICRKIVRDIKTLNKNASFSSIRSRILQIEKKAHLTDDNQKSLLTSMAVIFA